MKLVDGSLNAGEIQLDFSSLMRAEEVLRCSLYFSPSPSLSLALGGVLDSVSQEGGFMQNAREGNKSGANSFKTNI